MARAYADALGAELAIVAKHRISATRVEAMNVIGDVEGRDVLLVDDMTETAGTLCAAAEILHKHGAKRIFAGVSHAIISNLANERLASSHIEEVITTDSVPQAMAESSGRERRASPRRGDPQDQRRPVGHIPLCSLNSPSSEQSAATSRFPRFFISHIPGLQHAFSATSLFLEG